MHDGAQQHLVALAVNLSLAASVTVRNVPRAAELIRDLQPAATTALATLDELSLGIYPRLLATRGLAVALQHAVATSPVPVSLLHETLSPVPQQIVGGRLLHLPGGGAERSQTCAGHHYLGSSGIPSRATGHRRRRRWVRLRSEAASAGSGLAGMRDRVESLGGALVVTSRAGERDGKNLTGHGTTVSAWIPLAVAARRLPELADDRT